MSPDLPIPAIVLAAGLSSRMQGRFKPLLPLAGHPLIHHVIHTLTQIPQISPILLITGHRAEEVHQAATTHLAAPLARRVLSIFNPNYATTPMLSSIQLGVRSLPPAAPAFLLSLADQPAILPQTLSALLSTWQTQKPPILLPTHNGKRGHPLILSSTCLPEILSLLPHETLKTLTQRHAPHTLELPVPDPGILTDIDTPKDYERLLKSWPPPLVSP